MAKKASAPVVEEAPKEEEKFNLSGAIRTALDTLGVGAETEAVKTWITHNYPGSAASLESKTFGSTLSNQRTKKRGGGEGGTATTRSRTATVPSAEPTLADVMLVAKLADERGGVTELLRQVQEMYDLVGEVGSLDKVHKCLLSLKTLRGE